MDTPERRARIIQPNTLEYSQLEIHSLADLIKLRNTDALTGLPNQNWPENKLPKMLNAFDGNSALLILDLDGFKEINDTEGYQEGNELLKKVAIGLRLSNDDKSEHQNGQLDIVFRMGGDEFGIFLPGVSTQEDLDKIIKRLQEGLNIIGIGASINGALHRPGEEARSLYDRADAAMHHTKEINKADRVIALLSPEDITEIETGAARIQELLKPAGLTTRDIPALLRGLEKKKASGRLGKL